MGSRIARLVGLTMVAGLAYVPAAQAGQHFSIRLGIGAPAPVAVAPIARRGYVWQPGYYVRTAYGVRWVRGAWVPVRYGRVDRRDRDRADFYSRRDWDQNAYRDRDRDRHRARNWRRDRESDRGQWSRDRDWRE